MRQSRPQRKVVPGAAPGLLKVPEGAQAPTLHLIAYGSEGFTEGRLDSPGELLALREGWDTVWLDVRGLGDGELLRRFGELFGIHRLALEDVANVPQRPKLETYDQHHFLVIQQVDTEDPEEEEQVTLFVGEGFVLTFQEHEGDWFEGVRERLRVGHGLIRKEGADYLTYALLDAAVDSYFPALEQVGEQLESLEEQIIADATMDLMTQVRRVKRRLMTMRRQAWPQREVVGQLLRAEEEWIGEETRTHLRDCHDHAMQVLDLLENHREMASGLMDFHMSMVSHRMNEIMKVLTVTATIFIPLSFVAGLYGMNFDAGASRWNMPELALPFGYPGALMLMGSMAATMLVYFYRKGWIGKGR